MGQKYDFDYIIIGSGPAGRTAALRLSRTKKHVALVEEANFGGSEVTTRNIPTSTSLNFAKNYYNLTTHPATTGQDIHFNLPTITAHQERMEDWFANFYKESLANVTLLNGHAHFLDPHTISLGNSEYTASNFILATGAKLKYTGISGLDAVNYLTPTTALKIRRLPQCVFVVGGGPTGCEIAEYYAKLGTKVIIMELGTRLLPREDKEVGACMTEYFTSSLGITVITHAKVVALSQDASSKIVIFSTNSQEKMVRVDCIVMATGHEPVIDYGLENTGVSYKRTGIKVDKNFETTAKHIYAIGDAIGTTDSSTDISVYQANLLTNSLINHTKVLQNYAGFIRTIHTSPSVSVVGMNERDLTARDLKCKRSIVYFKDLPYSYINNDTYGFVKLLASSKGHLIGATIVGKHSDLLIEELALALRQRIAISSIASTPHVIGNNSEAVKLAAKNFLK